LYALRDCTDQLRKLNNVSITITAREHVGDVYVVTAQARLASGRTDESTGAVPLKGLAGESLANAYMKAETKAKRRVTLSICGLGFLDESEVASIDRFENLPPEKPAPAKAAAPEPPKVPPVPDIVGSLPAWFAKGMFGKLAPGIGKPFEKMTLEDLEELISLVGDNKARIKDPTACAWATAIQAEATMALRDLQMDRLADDASPVVP
jgi:hypothetical protein